MSSTRNEHAGRMGGPNVEVSVSIYVVTPAQSAEQSKGTWMRCSTRWTGISDTIPEHRNLKMTWIIRCSEWGPISLTEGTCGCTYATQDQMKYRYGNFGSVTESGADRCSSGVVVPPVQGGRLWRSRGFGLRTDRRMLSTSIRITDVDAEFVAGRKVWIHVTVVFHHFLICASVPPTRTSQFCRRCSLTPL